MVWEFRGGLILSEDGHANVNHSHPKSGSPALTIATERLWVVPDLLHHGANGNPRLNVY